MKDIPVRKLDAYPDKPGLSSTFRIKNLADLLGGQDMTQALHRHDYFFILILKKGRGRHTIDFTTYEVKDHSVFFLRPGQVHTLFLNAECTGFLIQFNSGFYHPDSKFSMQLLHRVSKQNVCQLDVSRAQTLFSVLDYTFKEFSEKQNGYEEVIKSNLNIFFVELVRNRIKPASASPETLYDQQRLEEFLELLEGNISKRKQVSEYAAMLNLSSYQLNSITKSVTGKTCTELINDQIILEAKRYLLATTDRIKEIAYHLGYDDVSYFIRFFKKYTGYSPETFRQMSEHD